MTPPSATVHFTLPALGALIADALRRLGLGAAHVGPVADTILAGERDGGGSHGLYRLLMVARTLREGRVAADAVPVAEDAAPGLVRVHAGGGFAPLAFRTGLPMLADKARATGIAAMAINDCAHFAALFPEAEAVARAGLVGLCCTGNHAWVAPAGGTRPLFGTNPLAFSWPRTAPDGTARDPFVFDFATTAGSRGDIELHRRAGRPLPPGWGIDAAGQPSTDPAEVLAGAMLPFGGHKGSALALMVELIAGPLIGDLTGTEAMARDGATGSAPRGGELVLAIDPARFMGARMTGRPAAAEGVFDAIVAQGAHLPSLRRYANRRRAIARGVDVPAALVQEVEALA